MADEAKQEESAKTKAAEEPRTYHRDRIIAEGETLFGQPSHVVVAALSSGRSATKVHFTLDEVKRSVKDYLDHEVEIDHPFPEEA